MEKQGRERGDKGCVCSWKKGVMGVKKDGRKEGRSWEEERGWKKMGVKVKGIFRERGGRLNLQDGFMTRLFKGCLVALNL